MSNIAIVDLYQFEKDRIGGLTEGEHMAYVLCQVPLKGHLSISSLRSMTIIPCFYRLEDGTPCGPGGFGMYTHNDGTRYYILLDPDYYKDY